MTRLRIRLTLAALFALAVVSCSPSAPAPTAADAKTFIDEANASLLKIGTIAAKAGWVQPTYITDDTEALNAR